jgi:DNA adenine methylase
MVVNDEVKRPLGPFFGGKWKLAPWILSHMPAHRVYVELFGGGGSVLLRKPRSHLEVYNDLDSEMVNVFRVLRERPNELVRAIDLTPYAREEYELALEFSEDPVERARRCLVRMGLGFSGSSSQYEPGSSARPPGFATGDLRAGGAKAVAWSVFGQALINLVERVKGVTVEHRDAAELVPVWDSAGTVFYADPPYLPEVRRTKKAYKYEMSEEQHIELARVLNGVKGSVLVSGYASPLYEDLYRGWERHEKNALSQGASRKSPLVDAVRVEVLWVKRAEG